MELVLLSLVAGALGQVNDDSGDFCPGRRCWDYTPPAGGNAGQCTLRDDPTCVELKCNFNQMVVKFTKEVFGHYQTIDKFTTENTGADNNCLVYTDGEFDIGLTWTADLGKCGTTVAKDG